MVILPMVVQVAADEPETAAKMVQPRMLVCSRRPGRALTQGARPRNMLSDSLVRNRISPIQTNRGKAVSVQLLEAPQIVIAMASPAGRDENSSMPIHATPASVRPIQTPVPSSRNRETTSRLVTSISFMVGLPALWIRLPRNSITHSSIRAISSTVVPTPIRICGIQSGVASLPVEMSSKLCDCQARRHE